MSAFSNFGRMRDLFAGRFEPDGDGYLYRKNFKSAPIRVSAAERDGFVATFARRIRYAIGAAVLGTVLLIGLLTAVAPDPDTSTGRIALWASLCCFLVPFVAFQMWAWYAPARALARRAAAGPVPSADDARRAMFAKMSYAQLGLAVLVALLLVGRAAVNDDLLQGWGRLWLVAGALMIGGAGIQAFRKWRTERE